MNMIRPAAELNQTNNVNNVNNHTIITTDQDDNECTVREQDRFMPIANVIRIMSKILPLHAKILDDAKQTIQECVSEFISFLTGEAKERCQREQRKTITAEDVLWAMSKLGFDDYIEPLTVYLHRYREMECERWSMGGGAFGEEAATCGRVSQLRRHFIWAIIIIVAVGFLELLMVAAVVLEVTASRMLQY